MPSDDADRRSTGVAPSADTARLEQLRRMPVLRDASEDALRRIAAVAGWRSYGLGGMILDLDDPSRDVWFVVEGVVRIQVRTPSGREIILSEIGAGGMFGEIAAIDGAARIGARREAVSREFADLMRRGLIAKERGAIVLLQPHALRHAVEAELEAEAGL